MRIWISLMPGVCTTWVEASKSAHGGVAGAANLGRGDDDCPGVPHGHVMRSCSSGPVVMLAAIPWGGRRTYAVTRSARLGRIQAGFGLYRDRHAGDDPLAASLRVTAGVAKSSALDPRRLRDDGWLRERPFSGPAIFSRPL